MKTIGVNKLFNPDVFKLDRFEGVKITILESDLDERKVEDQKKIALKNGNGYVSDTYGQSSEDQKKFAWTPIMW